jgi:hypothetical protein
MTRTNRNSTMNWLRALMLLALAVVVGPMPAGASQTNTDAALYEVTEDMYLKDAAGKFVTSPVLGGRRVAVARLSGWAKVGTPLCPSWVLAINPLAKRCTVNASGADDLSLSTGQGTLSGTFAVVVQGDNMYDAEEFVIMTGTFKGDADLSPAFANQAPLGFITNGVATVDGYSEGAFTFSGTFRLPFKYESTGQRGKAKKNHGAFYLGDNGYPFRVRKDEKSLGVPTVRIDIKFSQATVLENATPDDDNDD